MQALPPSFVQRRACRTSCIATTRTCVHYLSGNLLAAVRRILFFVLERRNTPFAHQPITIVPLSTRGDIFSVSSGGIDAYNSGLACVLYFFATHLARTLGFPGCPLSVSAHPVLMGAFTVSRRRTSQGTLVHISWRRMYPTSSRLAFAHSSGSSHPPLMSSQCRPSHKLSSSCSS